MQTKKEMGKEEKQKFDTKGWNTKTDNPKLGVRELSDGRGSLYLLYNYGYNSATGKTLRKKEYLSLYILPNPRNTD